jgi:uncharacterized protein (DUF433 family)
MTVIKYRIPKPDSTSHSLYQVLKEPQSTATYTRAFLDVLVQATETVKQITVDPNIMHGAPCIAGTRIPVYVILEKLEGGYNIDKICQAYPHLTGEQIKAAVRYAAEVMEASVCEKATQQHSSESELTKRMHLWQESFDYSLTKV